MVQVSEQNRDRIKSAAAVAALHLILGYAFLTGLGAEAVREAADTGLKLFDTPREPLPSPARAAPPDTASADRARPQDPEGAASPPNRKDTPTQVVAPAPEIRLEVPPLVPVAPVAGQGNAPAAGAATVPGPGTGRGGIGTGLGSGRHGSGTGGGGGGRGTRARWISGRIRDSDYPRTAYEAGVGGTVYLRFVVAPSGRVGDCAVTRSSGHAELDAVTCRLIMRRFRYRPARDARGRPVAEVIEGQQDWEVASDPPPIDVEPTIPD